MNIIVSGPCQANVIKVDGVCYEFFKETEDEATHAVPGESFDNCSECAQDSGDPDPPNPGDGSSDPEQSCVYSLCPSPASGTSSDAAGEDSSDAAGEDSSEDTSPQLKSVTFTVTRSARKDNTITFTKTAGTGPSSISFGPDPETVTVQMTEGTTYSISGTGDIQKQSSTKIGLEDGADGDYNDLTVSSSKVGFISASTFQLAIII